LAQAILPAVNDQGQGVGVAMHAPGLPQLVAARNNAVAEAQVLKKGKNPDKIKCNWCGVAGHIAQDCTVVLYDYCEHLEHANNDCPLHNAPKSLVVMYRLADEDSCLLRCLLWVLINQRWRIPEMVISQLKVVFSLLNI
jgi:hypothetical protein